MSTFTSSGGQQSVTLSGSTNPQIDNVPLTLADTEYSVTLPPGIRQFLVRLRDTDSDLKFRYVSGSDFLTINRGCHYGESDLTVPSLTIYLESNSASQIAEIVTWS